LTWSKNIPGVLTTDRTWQGGGDQGLCSRQPRRRLVVSAEVKRVWPLIEKRRAVIIRDRTDAPLTSQHRRQRIIIARLNAACLTMTI
jgi:hypothetical protein